jgi:hypothetical protein
VRTLNDKSKPLFVLFHFSSGQYFIGHLDCVNKNPVRFVFVIENSRMNPNKTFLITGYTADVGPYYGDCDWMSRVRAERMRDVLVQAGVEESRIQTQGLAAQNPVGDNSTPEGMAANRRVEVEVVK